MCILRGSKLFVLKVEGDEMEEVARDLIAPPSEEDDSDGDDDEEEENEEGEKLKDAAAVAEKESINKYR